MTATRIDGRDYADGLRKRVKNIVSDLSFQPTLAVVLVGEDPASQVYVQSKIKYTQECGMRSVEHKLPASTSEETVVALVAELNSDPDVDGILVQLPLPEGIRSNLVIAQIDPAKDVDGLTEASAGRLTLDKPGLRPCTPVGCVLLARHQLGDLTGLNCVVIGRSILVGKPAALMFLEQDCTITIVHPHTKNIEDVCRTADILVSAAGSPHLVKTDWVKPGACVIDVGINRVPSIKYPGKTRLVGDVDYKNVRKVAASITPVPGGVGPMTIACLLRNTLMAACIRRDVEVPSELRF